MAPYYNSFQNYQPPYFNSFNANPQLPQQSANPGINWVTGEAGAKSFLVAPNTTVLLMDSEESKFYLKGADESGMPKPLRVFEYSEITNKNPRSSRAEASQYVTKQEFDDFKDQIMKMMEGRNEQHL